MRTALVLLVVLAAASILGSLFPQEGLSPQRVDQYFARPPGPGPGAGAPGALRRLRLGLVHGHLPGPAGGAGRLPGPEDPGPGAGAPLPPAPRRRPGPLPHPGQLRHPGLPRPGHGGGPPGPAPQPLPAGRARRGAGWGEGLPAGGGQPAVPRVAAGAAGRAGLRQGLRVPRPGGHRRGRDLGQRPGRLRQLQPRALLRPRAPGPLPAPARRLHQLLPPRQHPAGVRLPADRP